MASAIPSRTAGQSALRSQPAESDVLGLDAHTIKDLELFESESGDASLYGFCNLTRTGGGARALRRRMRHPWASASRIRATQDSLSFILAQREIFERLPASGYSTGRVRRYLNDTASLVTRDNPVEFGLGAFDLWVNHDRDYSRIVRGVQVACRLLAALRAFVGQPELESAGGELVPLLQEMRELLALPRLSRIPDKEIRAWGIWRILRIDQVFRLHERAAVKRLLELIYEADALVALADVIREHDLLLPKIESGPLRVHAEGLTHPLVRNAVPNPVELDQQRRLLFLTGPNMAGKTTYLRAFATALYLAHLGTGVPARSFSFVPAERLFSSISLNDDLHGGVSYFRAEALRVKAIAQAVAQGYRVIALMDEPFKGTNVKDALDASLAVLVRFAAREECLFMFSSHLIELSQHLRDLRQIDCRHFEAEEGAGRLSFEYRLRSGVSSQRLGMRVLREEGIFELLDGAQD